MKIQCHAGLKGGFLVERNIAAKNIWMDELKFGLD